MAIPKNLTLIRLPARDMPSLSELRESMMAIRTQYVMVIGPNDEVDLEEPITGDVAYLPTVLRTRRAVRQTRPALPYDPVLLGQINFIGRPIINVNMTPLMPTSAYDPWHSLLLAAQAQRAVFKPLTGTYTQVESWPRPVRSGELWDEHRTSFDPAASNAESINGRPYPVAEDRSRLPMKIYHRNCDDRFLAGLMGEKVTLVSMPTFDWDTIRQDRTSVVGWMDGIEESLGSSPAEWLKKSLIPGVRFLSPGITQNFDLGSLRYGNYWFKCGIYPGFNPQAWVCSGDKLGKHLPTYGHTSSYVTLRTL